MLARDLFRLSTHNLLLHKTRSFLTSLGIIFGVGSVIAMLAISEGAKKQALQQIEAMGIDNVIVHSKEPNEFDTSNGTSDQTGTVKEYGLTVEDLNHIKRFDNIESIVPMRDVRKTFTKGTKSVDVKLVATTPGFLDATKCELVQGRWLSPVDIRRKAAVCVIGRNVKRKLFSFSTSVIIGQKIPLEGKVLTVVGIIENNHGTTLPEIKSPNDMILAPITTVHSLFGDYSPKRFSARSRINIHVQYDIFIAKVRDVAFIDNTARRVSSYLAKAHGRKDWDVKVPLDLLKQKERTQNIFTIVMGSIAGISLIVGGIGIMNIMLANVYERKKEIGTRRALGAKRRDILAQFLIETVFLTLMGGVLGVALGVGISEIVTKYANWPVSFSLPSVLLSLGIAAAVGIVFGTYPAWQAARQNPIDALRSE